MKFNILVIKKLIIFILILQGQIIYSAEKRKIESLDATENSEYAKKQRIEEGSNCPEALILISTEGNKYAVPFKAAMRSKMINAAWEGDQGETEFLIDANNEHLKILVNILNIIEKNRNKRRSKELYELIQDFYLELDDSPQLLNELYEWFLLAIGIDNDDLLNTIADKIAQVIMLNHNNFTFFAEKILPEHWHLIERYYYLRSSQLKLRTEDMLFVKDNALMEKLGWKYIKSPETFDANNISEKIISLMNLSIQDLLDYDKRVRATVYYEEPEYLVLDLSNCGLRRLDGWKNIGEDIDSILHLNLDNNQISYIYDEFDKVGFLYLSNNKISSLEGLLGGKRYWQKIYLSNNPINNSEAGKAMFEQFKQDHPNLDFEEDDSRIEVRY